MLTPSIGERIIAKLVFNAIIFLYDYLLNPACVRDG